MRPISSYWLGKYDPHILDNLLRHIKDDRYKYHVEQYYMDNVQGKLSKNNLKNLAARYLNEWEGQESFSSEVD